MKKQLVGFGFGPIQLGLVLAEAQASGNYDRFVIAEIDGSLVDAVRRNGNAAIVNVAHRDRIEHRAISGIEMLNPKVDADRAALCSAIRDADEFSTAIPSVDFYDAGGSSSIARLLADNADASRLRIVYTCENNNYAAEILGEKLRKLRPTADFSNLDILNTVIGKMSGVIRDKSAMQKLGLEPMVPGGDRAMLVDA